MRHGLTKRKAEQARASKMSESAGLVARAVRMVGGS
jgi:hypothetical protein